MKFDEYVIEGLKIGLLIGLVYIGILINMKLAVIIDQRIARVTSIENKATHNYKVQSYGTVNLPKDRFDRHYYLAEVE